MPKKKKDKDDVCYPSKEGGTNLKTMEPCDAESPADENERKRKRA
ncbi:MAG: hypothetical protein Q4Q53_04645 [Methanocorpusculum sp.]|nr:hypothetical protein [Methanocorpusculum sp.]